jgi:hypothetical protein
LVCLIVFACAAVKHPPQKKPNPNGTKSQYKKEGNITTGVVSFIEKPTG